MKEILVANTENDFNKKNLTANLNWKQSIDSTGKELSADFDYEQKLVGGGQ